MPDPDERARFLAALYDQAHQDGEDPEAVAERIYDNLRGVSRRELLQAGGALGVGGLLGGGGGYALTQDARGQAATDDSDGNVGTPDDRVDVFADGVDGNVVSAGHKLNNADLTSATEGEALLKGGSGTDLRFGSGNVPNFQEDSNSPFSATSTSSFTVSLADDYDIWSFHVEVVHPGGGSGDGLIEVTNVNSESPSMWYTERSGTDVSGASTAPIGSVEYGETIQGRFGAGGRSGSYVNFYDIPMVDGLNSPSTTNSIVDDSVTIGNVTSPLSSFTLEPANGPIDIQVVAYGVDV